MHQVYLVTGFRVQNVDTSKRVNRSEVPMFYTYAKGAPYDPESAFISAIAMFLASCYGGLHCLAWSFARLTYAETIMWRFSSLVICIAPMISCITFLVATWFSHIFYMPSLLYRVVRCILLNILTPFHNHIYIPVLLPCYIIARFILIGLAFAQLRSLPQSAHRSVNWSKFLPHV